MRTYKEIVKNYILIYEKSRFVLRAVRGYNERKSASDFPEDFDLSVHWIGLSDGPDISGQMRGLV